MKLVVRSKALYTAPEGRKPPPATIRGLLILTCTGVSFFHGSNDGQKGMGLIMLILIGAAPTAYALNRAIPDSTTPMFLQATQEAQAVFQAHARTSSPPADAAAARATVGEALKSKDVNKPEVYAALATLTADIGQQVKGYGAIKAVPAAATPNVRNDMYLASDAVRVMGAHPPGFDDADMAKLKSLRSSLDSGTKFIPTWVKVSVALALGLGTMVGWKRIVVTVGEKIGKTHLTYAQGASRRDRGDGDDRHGGRVRAAGVHDPCAVERRGGHDGGERVGAAVGHDQEHGAGLGSDAAGGDADCRIAVCDPAPGVLVRETLRRWRCYVPYGICGQVAWRGLGSAFSHDILFRAWLMIFTLRSA